MQSTTRRRIQWKQIYMPEIRWLEIIIIKIFKDLRENSKRWMKIIKWTAAHQASLFFTVAQNLLKFMSIESLMPSNHLILCCPLLLPSIFLRIRVFSNELAVPVRWPKYWSFSISPSNEYSALLSFRIDWFHLLAVQQTLKCLLKYYNLKASILWHSDFFMVQLSHLYMTTGKTRALTIRTFAGKVTSLLFNTLSKFVIAFLPRSKHLLISCLQSPSRVILEPKKIKSVTVSTFPYLSAMKW